MLYKALQESESSFVMSTPYENVERQLSGTLGKPMVLFDTGFSTFSNFYLCPFTIQGFTYCTSEQFYQSEKAAYFGDCEKAQHIAAEARPSRCKKMAYEIKNFDTKAWQSVARQVMLRAVLAKFRQNTPARQKLLGTGDALLVYATPFGQYWATGLEISDNRHIEPEKWRGRNVLGSILIEVREILKSETV